MQPSPDVDTTLAALLELAEDESTEEPLEDRPVGIMSWTDEPLGDRPVGIMAW